MWGSFVFKKAKLCVRSRVVQEKAFSAVTVYCEKGWIWAQRLLGFLHSSEEPTMGIILRVNQHLPSSL